VKGDKKIDVQMHQRGEKTFFIILKYHCMILFFLQNFKIDVQMHQRGEKTFFYHLKIPLHDLFIFTKF